MRSAFGVSCAMGIAAAILGVAADAGAQDRAVVDVGAPPPATRYAQPPMVAADPPADEASEEAPRSPLRFQVGPAGVSTGKGLGLGLGIGADMGRGTVGFRLAAAWLRGEPSGADPSSLGDGLSQYTGELTLDLRKRGPWHPVLGLGFGGARVNRGDAAGWIGVGTARLGLEYALGLDDADVRFGGGVTGVLPGPSDREVADVKGWALFGAGVAIGF